MEDYEGKYWRDLIFRYMFGLKLTNKEKDLLKIYRPRDSEEDHVDKEDIKESLPDTSKLEYWHGKTKKS